LTHATTLACRACPVWQAPGLSLESAEEDAILDEMEDIWLNLIDDERAILRLEGPRCWPMESSSLPPQLDDTLYPSAPTPWAYEGFHSPAEAILSEEAA